MAKKAAAKKKPRKSRYDRRTVEARKARASQPTVKLSTLQRGDRFHFTSGSMEWYISTGNNVHLNLYGYRKASGGKQYIISKDRNVVKANF